MSSSSERGETDCVRCCVVRVLRQLVQQRAAAAEVLEDVREVAKVV